jgi:hypothetical protein
MARCSSLAARNRDAQKVSELQAHLTIIIPKAEECQDNTTTPESRNLAERVSLSPAKERSPQEQTVSSKTVDKRWGRRLGWPIPRAI